MADAGILARDARVELLDGAIVAMSPIGPPHASLVDRLTAQLVVHFHGRACVRVQNPLTLDDWSEPQPDVAVVRGDCADYAKAHPGPGDVLFLVEVADSSLSYDREQKLPAYARAGVREVWLVDVATGRVEAHTHPSPEGYLRIAIHQRGDALTPEATPDLQLRVADLFG